MEPKRNTPSGTACTTIRKLVWYQRTTSISILYPYSPYTIWSTQAIRPYL